jgi:hypothetical protein
VGESTGSFSSITFARGTDGVMEKPLFPDHGASTPA